MVYTVTVQGNCWTIWLWVCTKTFDWVSWGHSWWQMWITFLPFLVAARLDTNKASTLLVLLWEHPDCDKCEQWHFNSVVRFLKLTDKPLMTVRFTFGSDSQEAVNANWQAVRFVESTLWFCLNHRPHLLWRWHWEAPACDYYNYHTLLPSPNKCVSWTFYLLTPSSHICLVLQFPEWRQAVQLNWQRICHKT